MIKRKLKDAVNWFKYRTTHRYHIIDISGEDGYSRGWIDSDHAMYLACFKLLRNFVEKEFTELKERDMTLDDYVRDDYQPEGSELEFIKEQIARENEIRAIYVWWTKTRPEERKRHDSMPTGCENIFMTGGKIDLSRYETPEWTAWKSETERLEAKDDEMFDRLMKVRKHLWT